MSEIKVEEEYHTLVRPLSEKEYDELRQSIQTHGMLVPIVVNREGIILDGHNRFKICHELGIKPVVFRKDFPSKTAEKLFVIESNLRRRQLSDIERVELGMQLEPLEKELAHERRTAALKVGDTPAEMELQSPIGSIEHNGESEEGRARDVVAKKVGLSPTTYHRGKTVLEKGSDALKEEVKSEKKSISAAYDEVKGKGRQSRKPKEADDILMLPQDRWEETENAIVEARAANDKQVVLRHNKHEVIGIGKEIEIST